MNIRVTSTRSIGTGLGDLTGRIARGHSPVQRVARQQIPYFQQQGWTKDGQRYSGSYQTPRGAFYGVIDEHGAGFYRFYVYQPPERMRYHSHWSCFQERPGGWYEVHMARMPRDVSSGIISVERILTESMES